MEGSSGLPELASVKDEPADPEAEPEHLPHGAVLAVQVKVEPLNGHYLDSLEEAECTKQETECVNQEVTEDPSCSYSECIVSKTPMLVGLDNHGVKDEVMLPSSIPSCSDSECGVSEAAMLAGLYTDHEVKDELVLGLECPHRPDVTLVVNGRVSSVLRDCCVTLERRPHVETLVKRRQDTTHADQESDDEKLYGANCQIQDKTHTDQESDTDELYARDKEPICDLCGESFSLKSDLLKHVIDHIYRPSSAEQEGSVHSYALTGQWTQELERALCRQYAIRDCCVCLERLQHHEALAGNNTQDTTPTDLESDTEEIHTRVDYEKPTCDLCGESFARKSDLMKHIMIHIHMPTAHHPQRTSTFSKSDTEKKSSEIPIYTCHICSKIFKRKNNLNYHIKCHSIQFKCNNTGEKPYCCETCGKLFPTRGGCNRHMKIHTDIKPYLCDVCKKGFKTVGELNKHTRTHTDIKPHSCDVCKKLFRTKTHLKVHARAHCDIRPYSCDVCKKTFRTVACLKRHTLVHGDIRPYSCDVCKKGFSTAAYLKTHTLTHTRPHSCDVCQKRFATATYLKTHTHTLLHKNNNIFQNRYFLGFRTLSSSSSSRYPGILPRLTGVWGPLGN